MEENPTLWDVKYFDCCLSAPVCLLACICPAITQSMIFFKNQDNSGLRCLFAQCCCCIGLSINRGKIRERYGIEGSCCMDCILYSCICCCCHACLVSQEYRQSSLEDPVWLFRNNNTIYKESHLYNIIMIYIRLLSTIWLHNRKRLLNVHWIKS